MLVALLPVSLLPFGLAQMAWLWLTIVMLGLSVSLCLQLAGERGDGRLFLWTLIAGLFFGPVLSLLKIGQVSGLLLLPLIASIYLLEHKHDFWAGALLLLSASKPHITFLALALLGWWALSRQRWKFFLGQATALAFTLVVFAWLLPTWPAAYRSLLTQMQASDWLSSTWWSLLETLTGGPVFRWAAFALTPLVFWLANRVARLGWLTAINWALLPWLALAPYGFTFDFILLLPALIQLVVWLAHRQVTGPTAWGVAVGLLASNLIVLAFLSRDTLPYYWTAWLPAAFLLIYGMAYRYASLTPASLGKG
jgi:hypothetical protein